MLPFVSKITDYCTDSLVGHSIWCGFVLSCGAVLSSPIYNYVYLSVPFGWHTFRFYVFCFVVNSFVMCIFRVAAGNRIPPFNTMYIALSTLIVIVFAYRIKIFKHVNERDGRIETYGIEPWFKFPKSMRHNTKLRNEAVRLRGVATVTFMFGFLYPILGALFFQSGIILQSVLVPVFFALRTWYEYKADQAVTNTFGSDKLVLFNLYGVMLHEACLSVMITSIQHPLVFVILILADVFENGFCLWSLSRSKASIVAPSNEMGTHKKSLSKRSSSVFSLAKDLRVKDESSKGTALFIAATLLQREMVETLVPIQAALWMSFMYSSSVKSNSMVSRWMSDEDYIQTMTYLGIDLGVEIVVFLGTVLVLKRIYPTFSPFRILMGLVRSSSMMMFSQTICVWITVLLYQSTLSGLDPTLQFKWLDCEGENATWVGGFDWENC